MITIILASVLTWLMKALPFISRVFNNDGKGFFVRAMQYAVCFIMGSTIVNVAFSNKSASDFVTQFNTRDIVIIITLAASFIVTRYTGSILKSLFFSMALLIIAIKGLL